MSSDDSVVPLSEAVADYGGDHGADGRYSWSEGDDLEHEESSAQALAWSLQRASSRAALALELAAWPWRCCSPGGRPAPQCAALPDDVARNVWAVAKWDASPTWGRAVAGALRGLCAANGGPEAVGARPRRDGERVGPRRRRPRGAAARRPGRVGRAPPRRRRRPRRGALRRGAPRRSYALDAGPEAWLRPPRLALPAAADAWARAAPWARAALAFGDVPAAAWREDSGDYGPEAAPCSGGRARVVALLLQLLAAAPAEGAGAIARVLESAVAARDAPGVRAACALAVAALRAPASSASRARRPRARARPRSRASSRTATATSTTTRRSSARPNGRRARPRPGPEEGRRRTDAGGAAPRGGSESDESSAESPDEDKADEEADRRERDLLGLAARTRAPDGERAFLDKACPRGAALFSPVPSYAAVVFACELLHGLRRRDAGEAVARARASATRVVGVVFRGLDDATCAWLRDLGGAAGDLKAGRCVGLKAAAWRRTRPARTGARRPWSRR
ncbi:hypothetical protein SO694_00057161 [Aureococcus anophagefferens]|uniref:Uncharacterized protein n=1 Tax=Aureococcus anophagefferens TaxID=44056 RepID=A0ABR1FX66_AURAN